MNNKLKMFFFVALCFTIVCFPVLGGGQTGKAAVEEEIELRFLTFMVGAHTETPWFTRTIDGFNEQYKGKIKVVIDGATDQQVFHKLLTDAASDTMPDLFFLKGNRDEFLPLTESGTVVPLNDFANEMDIKEKLVYPNAVKKFTADDGNLYGISLDALMPAVYYNKEHFQNAGISEFPQTWDDFLAACEKLKAAGHTPISQMTGEDSWVTILLLSLILGSNDAGLAWLNTPMDSKNWTDPALIDALRIIKKCLTDYTTPDAIGAGYGTATTYFIQGQTSMVVNGPWMAPAFYTDDAPEGMAEKIGYVPGPGDTVIAFYGLSLATGAKTKEKLEAVFEFFRYMMSEKVYADYVSQKGCGPTLKVDLNSLEYNPIVTEYTPKALAANKCPLIYDTIKPAFQNGFGQIFPLLLDISAEEAAKKFQEIDDSN